MFPGTYFPSRYFAARYWPKLGATTIPVELDCFGIFVIPRMDGQAVTQPRINGSCHTQPRLDGQVANQG